MTTRRNIYKMNNTAHKWQGLIVALLYGVTSITITFFNKAVFSTYNFQASNTLTLAQGVFSIVFLIVLKNWRFLDYPDFSPETAKSLVSLSASFCGMVISGLAALKFVNVPMYSALRRLTTFIVIAGQYFMLNKTVSMAELNSVIMMVLGAVIAGWGDIEFDLYGYFLTALNCLITAAYLVLIAKKSKETGLNTFGLMFYNNLLSLPVIALLVLFTEWDLLVAYDQWSSLGFHFVFFMSALQAFALNYFVFLCSTLNSPLTTSITGQIKSILQTIVGLFTFGGVILTTSLIFGLFMSTVGGIWYGYVKYIEQTVQSKSKVDKNIVDLENNNRSKA